MPVLPAVGSMTVAPGLRTAAPLGVENHPERGAVFDRAAGVHVFELGEEFGRGRRREPRKPQQRGRPDQFEDVIHGPKRRPVSAGVPDL